MKKKSFEEEANIRYLLICFILGLLVTIGILVFSIVRVYKNHVFVAFLAGGLFFMLIVLWILVHQRQKKKTKVLRKKLIKGR